MWHLVELPAGLYFSIYTLNLPQVQAGRTTIVIAHRLSTIQNADVICSFKDGNIFEKGSHEVLMQDKNGLYSGLVQLQSRKEEKTKEEAEVKEEEYEDEDEEEIEVKGEIEIV